MATHENLTSLFTDIAEAIREKTGNAAGIAANDFPEAIAAIDTQENLDPELATQDNLIEQITTTLSRKLPENLDSELAIQDDLITQLTAALEGKAGVSGGVGMETCAIDISNHLCGSGIFYTNENQECVEIYWSETPITVLNGTIMFFTADNATYSGGIQLIASISDSEGDMFHIISITGDGSISSE